MEATNTTLSARAYPIVVVSFDRPHYLELVLRSLSAQTIPIAAGQIHLFQDGYKSPNGQDITDPHLVERCVQIFQEQFPDGIVHLSTDNLGVALNFDRAERYVFESLGSDAAFFFEDDLLLAESYLDALTRLTEIALLEPTIAYVAAYGNHRATLIDQEQHPSRLILMQHKWGFALTRRQWAAQRDILAPYLEIVARDNYRNRDHGAIKDYYRKLGFGSAATSQDGMKDVASCVLGTAKVMTFVCFGKYIGETGLHGRPQFYAHEKFGSTELYHREVPVFTAPSPEQLADWIRHDRTHGRRTLGLSNGSHQTPASPHRLALAADAQPPNTREPLEITAATVTDEPPLPQPEHLSGAVPTLSVSAEGFIRAIYRVLLQRDVDPIGLTSGMRQIRNGASLEDIMHWCLRSDEFVNHPRRFLNEYLPDKKSFG